MATQPPFRPEPMRLPGGPPQGGTIGDTANRLPEVAPLTPEPEPADQRGNLIADFWTGQYRQADPDSPYEAGRVVMRSDRSTASRERMMRYYSLILDALDLPTTENPGNWQSETTPMPSRFSRERNAGFFGWARVNQEMAILGALRERRRADPDFLPGIPDDYDGFHAWMIQQEQGQREQARQTINRPGGGLATLGGYLVEGISDPVNVATAPAGGGGRTLAQIAARSAIASAVVEAGQQPFIAIQRRELGENLTMGEAAANVGLAFVGGGVVGVGTAGIGRGVGHGYDFAIERVFNAMPEPVRDRWAARMRIVAPDASPADVSVREFVDRLGDREAAEFARDVVGTERLSPDERAAINVLERDAEIAEASPFARSPEGDEAHAGRLSTALRQLMETAAAPAPPRSSGLYGPLNLRSPSGGAAPERRVMQNGKLRIYAVGDRTPVDDAVAVLREIYPDVTANQGRRDPNSDLGRANPRSWHTRSGAAVDVDPVAGMTFEQFVQGFRDRGYTIIEALDETGAGRSAHATGDHWHVVLGRPASGAASAPPTFERMWSAIIANEGGTDSRGRFLTSPDGAHGPAQVMPDTAPEAARLAGLPWDEQRYRTDYDYNVALGQAYFREQLREFGNDPLKAAAAYNAGPGRLRQAIRDHGDDWLAHMPAETRDYVANFQRRAGAQGGGAATADGADDAAARAAIDRLYADAAAMNAPPARMDADPMDDAVAALRGAGDEIAPPQLRDDLDAMFEARREAMTSQAIADDVLPPYADDIIARADPDQRAEVEAFLREQWARERPAREAEMQAMREKAEAEAAPGQREDGEGEGQPRAAESPTPDAPPARAVEVTESNVPPLPSTGRRGTGRGPVRASRALDRDTMRMADELGLPTFPDFIAERLGTRQWVVAPRLTKALKEKGHTLAVSQDRLREVQNEWADMTWAAAASSIAPAPVPDIRIRAEELAAFDDIDSAGIRQVADSLEHDLRADIDAMGDAPFRLGDEGEEITARQLLESVNDDIEAAAALRACL